jgi:hypothetical protein
MATAAGAPLRCPKDGRFMHRIGEGKWRMCTCGELRCADGDVELGLALMRSAGWWR